MGIRKPVKIRKADEGHRQATWIELFIDLAYVVGISSLDHFFKDGFTTESIVKYNICFFLTFWIWNRFTWYASYYDNDDVPFRFAYLISIFPVLGLINSFDKVFQGDYTQAILSYVSANIILLYLWNRVLQRADDFHTNARHFFAGYGLSTVLLIAALLVPFKIKVILFIIGILSEIVAPILGWKNTPDKLPVNTHHIVERHGLFTIIILGEGLISIFRNYNLIQTYSWYMLLLGFIIIIGIWWIYFDCGFGFKTNLSQKMKRVFIFGYGHFFVFLSVAFICISIEYALHQLTQHSYTGISSTNILSFSLGCFLLILSLVQISISELISKRIYWTRIIFGIIFIIFSFVIYNPVIIIILSSFIIIVVLLNEINVWSRNKGM